MSKHVPAEVIFEDGIKFRLLAKHFRMPGARIHTRCPSCNAEVINSFNDNFFRNPVVNEELEFDCYCDACEHEWSIPCVIEMNFRIVGDSAREDELKESRAQGAVEHASRLARIAARKLSEALDDLDFSRGIDTQPDELLIAVLDEIKQETEHIPRTHFAEHHARRIASIRARVLAALNHTRPMPSDEREEPKLSPEVHMLSRILETARRALERIRRKQMGWARNIEEDLKHIDVIASNMIGIPSLTAEEDSNEVRPIVGVDYANGPDVTTEVMASHEDYANSLDATGPVLPPEPLTRDDEIPF